MSRFVQLLALACLSFLCITSSALAVREARNIKKRSISTALWNDMTLFEQYSAAAYCNSNGNSPGTKIACTDADANNCDLVQNSNTSTITEFSNTAETDATGFVAYDDTRNLTVISFRGSHSLQSFIADIEVSKEDTDICDGCKAHSGFWESWLEARDKVLGAAKTAADAKPSYDLIVTGHSLGGAMATLCAAELRNSGYDAALYTYGSPRVGNSALAQYVSNQKGGNYRMTHTNDPIPHLPFIAMGFEHVMPEYYIKSKNNVAVKASDIRELLDLNDWAGNGGQLFTNLLSHLWYFNSITACGGDDILELKKAKL